MSEDVVHFLFWQYDYVKCWWNEQQCQQTAMSQLFTVNTARFSHRCCLRWHTPTSPQKLFITQGCVWWSHTWACRHNRGAVYVKGTDFREIISFFRLYCSAWPWIICSHYSRTRAVDEVDQEVGQEVGVRVLTTVYFQSLTLPSTFV